MQFFDNRTYELQVNDNGVGLSRSIDMKNPPGFGLSLVQMLTQQLEGQLEVQREKGTTFRIIFPSGEDKNQKTL